MLCRLSLRLSRVGKHRTAYHTRFKHGASIPAGDVGAEELLRLNTGLRALLRESAQPVAVVTARLPGTGVPHGATLSSFTSIALAPYPLVAFSLRLPSRMAAALDEALLDTATSKSVGADLVVSVLEATQADLATRFARADAGISPFDGLAHDPPLTAEGLPYLDGCLGALSCKLVAPAWPLHDIDALARSTKPETAWQGEGVASQLYIARVTRVERAPPPEGQDSTPSLPLIYHRRAYTTVSSKPLPHKGRSG
jgi:flavin reductase (DIM6/NTAB) family NADH-FMN oxidoreductase RutF